MKKYTIATVSKVKGGHAWFDHMEEGVKKFGRETGHTTFLVGPTEANENLQIQVIEEVIRQKVDAICVVPFFPQALEMVLRKAHNQGIVVITHEASNQRNIDYDLEAFDNAAYGRHLMDHLAKYMGEEGKYAILLSSLTSQSHHEWATAAFARQQEKYPHLNLVTKKIEVREIPEIAHQKTQELLTTYPNLKGILGISMTATIGIGEVIDEKKLQHQVAVVGTGFVSECRRHLASGAIKLISFWDSADAGYVMNMLAVKVLNGEPVEDGMDLGVDGYRKITRHDKVIVGSAMIDATKETVSTYNF